MEPVYQIGVVHQAGFVNLAVVPFKEDLVVLHFHLTDLLILRHGDEGAVVHFDDLLLRNPGNQQEVEQHQRDHHQRVVENKGFLWPFDFIHIRFSSFCRRPGRSRQMYFSDFRQRRQAMPS